MATWRVAIACCRQEPGGPPADLFPDPESVVLGDALAASDVASEMVAWDDPDQDWTSFDAVVIRSTWDSVARPTEYLEWAQQTTGSCQLINPLHALSWGLDKKYLLDLERAGAPVVPTTWVEPGDDWNPPAGEFVVKPSISAGSRGTARYASRDADRARALVRQLHDAGQSVMIQKYHAAVENEGELSVVFIDGVPTHAVRKGPILELGVDVPEHPWERISWWGQAWPDDAESAIAADTMERVFEHLGLRLAYGRVDLIRGDDRQPLVNEVEIIDPVLSFAVSPDAANALAVAVKRRLQ